MVVVMLYLAVGFVDSKEGLLTLMDVHRASICVFV